MTIYRFGPFKLDREQLLLSLDDAPLPLGPKVVETLLALIEHPGEVLGKTELLDRVWPEGFVEEANLAQNIYVIRKTLRTHWDCAAIETVPRRGYRFVAAVAVTASAQAHVAEPVPIVVEAGAPIEVPRRIRRMPAIAGAAVAAVLALAIGIGTVGIARPRSNANIKALSSEGGRLYSIAMLYWNERTPESVQKSIRYFRDVVATDPHDARGYGGLASAYAIQGDYGYGPLSKAAAFRQAAAYARRALAVDSNSAEAHAALGLAEIDNNRTAEGQAEFRQAIALNSSYAPAHQWYGMSLLRAGDGVEAFTELRKAADLDPASVAATDWLAQAAYLARRYSDALNYAQQALDLSPTRNDVYTTLGLAYEGLGDYKSAIREYETYATSCAACRIGAAPFLAHAYAASHDYSAAETQLRIAQAGMEHSEVDPRDFVTALVAMGRRTEALQMLRNAGRKQFGAMLAIDPRMDPVRHDARFRRYVHADPSV
jgi:DNA-binding winged helix-turn-helix (wHTH) protein/tetratricopeptide (TPR) repeat protein